MPRGIVRLHLDQLDIHVSFEDYHEVKEGINGHPDLSGYVSRNHNLYKADVKTA